MSLKLIVLASSASFLFNRDHYPTSKDRPPTCNLRERACLRQSKVHGYKCRHATSSRRTYTRSYIHRRLCFTYFSHISMRVSGCECAASTWHVGVSRKTRLYSPWRLTNERTSMHGHFSLFSISIQINSIRSGAFVRILSFRIRASEPLLRPSWDSHGRREHTCTVILTIGEKSEGQRGVGEERRAKAERGSRPTPGVSLTRRADFSRGMLQTDACTRTHVCRTKWRTDPHILHA